jgi:hypothetical protein
VAILTPPGGCAADGNVLEMVYTKDPDFVYTIFLLQTPSVIAWGRAKLSVPSDKNPGK